jgi:hydroxylamine reductase (hybrid-cluster protein)
MVKGQIGQPFTTTELKTFLKECEVHIRKVESKITKYINNIQFDMLVLKNFRKEKFINDLNMAMCSHEEFVTFCKELDQILPDNDHPELDGPNSH